MISLLSFFFESSSWLSRLKGSKAELENWKTVFGSNAVKVQFSGFVLGRFLFSFFQPPPKVSSACWKHVFVHVLTVEEKIRVERSFDWKKKLDEHHLSCKDRVPKSTKTFLCRICKFSHWFSAQKEPDFFVVDVEL